MDTSSGLVDIVGSWLGLGVSSLGIALLVFLALTFSSYVKISTVLAIVRAGFGWNSLPSAFVTGALALVLSFSVMLPTLQESSHKIDEVLHQKSSRQQDAQLQALAAGIDSWKKFVSGHTPQKERERFAVLFKEAPEKSNSLGKEQNQTVSESWRVLAPAFFVSELKSAFATGLSLFLPLLVVELIVAHVLTGVGLQNLSVGFVSFPFKVLLFVLADGWGLISSQLISSYF